MEKLSKFGHPNPFASLLALDEKQLDMLFAYDSYQASLKLTKLHQTGTPELLSNLVTQIEQEQSKPQKAINHSIFFSRANYGQAYQTSTSSGIKSPTQ